MIKELNNFKKYLEGEIIRVRFAEQNNFNDQYSSDDEHLYATAYNVVSCLVSLNKNLFLEINSKFNHQLIKSTIENIFLLRMFSENKLSSKYIDLYKRHFKVINFQYLKNKIEINGSSKVLLDLREEYNCSIKKFMSYYPNLSKVEATRIFTKRYGWLYSYSYNGKESKLINVLNEYGTDYEINLYKHSSVYAHSNFFVADSEYGNKLVEYCIVILRNTIDISNAENKILDIDYSVLSVSHNEIGDLESDKFLNYNHAYKLKFKKLMEEAATKVYLENNPERLNMYVLTSYLKVLKNGDKKCYRNAVDVAYKEFINTTNLSISPEEFSKKVANKLFGFTFNKKGIIDDYDTFVKKQFNNLYEKRVISNTYLNVIEEVNLLDHPSMYAYLNIDQDDISEYLQLESELKDYLYK